MIITRSKQQVFGFIKDKIDGKLSNWKGKLLSPAGKEVTLKSVLLAFPNYVLSAFRITKKMGKIINSVMSKFWWGDDKGGKKTHWISWEKMSEPKNNGGLGFKDIHCFNKALLAKQIWRFTTNPNLLVSKILKGKYFDRQGILNAKVTRNVTWFWRGMVTARDVVEEGSRKRVGDGKTIKIWEDRWVQFNSDGKVKSPKPQNCQVEVVSQLIKNKCWNSSLLYNIFNKEEAEKILRIPISITGRKDRIYWKGTDNGCYSVKSGYELCKMRQASSSRRDEEVETSAAGNRRDIWGSVWKLNVKHKLKHFLWKCLNKVLPVKEVVHQRTSLGEPICTCCGEEVESIEHALLKCSHAQEIWKQAPLQWDGLQDVNFNFWRWWEKLLEARKREQGSKHIEFTVNILWQIWKSRNWITFNKEKITASEVINKATSEWYEFDMVNKVSARMSMKKTSEGAQHCGTNVELCNKVRICYDVNVNKTKNIVSYSIVAKNRWNEVIFVWAAKENREGCLPMEEANVIKLAMVLARQKRWTDLIIQGTNSSLMKKLQRQDSNDVNCATIIENILDLTSLFTTCSFYVIEYKSNVLAARLASFAENLKNNVIWENSFPVWVQADS